MLQLTRKADCGLRLMLEVGGSPSGATTTAEAAQRQQIPYEFLRKVAQTLAAQGLLVSERGVRGGFTLAPHPRPPLSGVATIPWGSTSGRSTSKAAPRSAATPSR